MNDTKATHKIECPCCHGEKYLYVFEEDRLVPQKFQCTRCMGKGSVMSEIAE
jgi:ribosomal protein S27AE